MKCFEKYANPQLSMAPRTHLFNQLKYQSSRYLNILHQGDYMSKEFHVFTHQDTQYEQAFVFEVERHDEDSSVEFKDLYLVTTTKHGELRTRICFDNMIQSILHTDGGNIDENGVQTVLDMFSDLIPKEKQIELEQIIQSEQEYKDLEKLLLTDPEELINASEYAIILEHADELKIDLQEKDNNETHTRGTN